ncbi:MAG TPA: AraC family transcriptional regulator ligand-binding domain-containing protein, partial [Thermoanaerobaculaceae bacterium]|nr:AraC family transcriptional regulator ligand-binding domain-containing protein [Thermoanaerobaculaceae bacterium]
MTTGINDLTPRSTPPRKELRGSVAAGVGKGLLDFAVSNGASRSLLASRAGVALEDLEDPDRRIPLERYAALMRAAALLCNEPAFALKFGEAVDLAELSFIGLLCYAAESVDDAFVQMNRYARVMIDVPVEGKGDRIRHVPSSRGTWVVDARADPNAFPELSEATFARMVGRALALGGQQRSFALEIHFTHAAPPYRAEFDRVFKAPVRFGSGWNAMLTDDAWDASGVLRPSRYAFKILSARAEALLAELDLATTARGQVERLLIPILHRGDASMELIAAKIGISRQTLYRRLRAEGVRFEELLDEL